MKIEKNSLRIFPRETELPCLRITVVVSSTYLTVYVKLNELSSCVHISKESCFIQILEREKRNFCERRFNENVMPSTE